MDKYVIFLNGVPGSGKNEFFDQLVAIENNYEIRSVSSIDCIRDLLAIPESRKDDETRNILSLVGSYKEKHDNYRTKHTALAVLKLLSTADGRTSKRGIIILVHTRENSMMKSIADSIKRMSVENINIIKVLIDRKSVMREVYPSDSDLEAHNDIVAVKDQLKVFNMGLLEDTFDPFVLLRKMFDRIDVIVVNNNHNLTHLAASAKTFTNFLEKTYQGKRHEIADL